jgi:hypothetical protein
VKRVEGKEGEESEEEERERREKRADEERGERERKLVNHLLLYAHEQRSPELLRLQVYFLCRKIMSERKGEVVNDETPSPFSLFPFSHLSLSLSPFLSLSLSPLYLSIYLSIYLSN